MLRALSECRTMYGVRSRDFLSYKDELKTVPPSVWEFLFVHDRISADTFSKYMSILFPEEEEKESTVEFESRCGKSKTRKALIEEYADETQIIFSGGKVNGFWDAVSKKFIKISSNTTFEVKHKEVELSWQEYWAFMPVIAKYARVSEVYEVWYHEMRDAFKEFDVDSPKWNETEFEDDDLWEATSDGVGFWVYDDTRIYKVNDDLIFRTSYDAFTFWCKMPIAEFRLLNAAIAPKDYIQGMEKYAKSVTERYPE